MQSAWFSGGDSANCIGSHSLIERQGETQPRQLIWIEAVRAPSLCSPIRTPARVTSPAKFSVLPAGQCIAIKTGQQFNGWHDLPPNHLRPHPHPVGRAPAIASANPGVSSASLGCVAALAAPYPPLLPLTPPLLPLYSPSTPPLLPLYCNRGGLRGTTGGLQGDYRGITGGIEGDYRRICRWAWPELGEGRRARCDGPVGTAGRSVVGVEEPGAEVLRAKLGSTSQTA